MSVKAASQIDQMIASGEFKPGDRLPPERALAQSLGVSRASLREAIAELQSRHLIEKRQGSGNIVAPRSPQVDALNEHLGFSSDDDELMNAIELRDIVEPRIAALAAERATESLIDSLNSVLQNDVTQLSARNSLILDLRFHLLLAHSTQNPLLEMLCSMTNKWTSDSRIKSHSSQAGRIISREGHERIYNSVIHRDPISASAAMIVHLREIHEVIDELSH